jgi:peptidoglycan/xylan/chitin deacetylase (PgdA/CDA1 family)
MRGLWRLKVALGKIYAAMRSKTLILAYHRVADLETDPQLLAVSRANFAEQLEIVKRYYNPITLTELVDALAKGESVKQGIVLTFDDGYIDNFLYARPLLEKFKVPANFFISTYYVEKKEEFWWDALEQLLLYSAQLPSLYECSLCSVYFSFKINKTVSSLRTDLRKWDVSEKKEPADNFGAYKKMHTHLKNLTYDQIQAHLRELEIWSGQRLECRELYRACSEQELIDFAQSKQVTIGSHTYKHMRMSGLTFTEQEFEFCKSQKDLRARLPGKDIAFFSYPFGGYKDFNQDSCALVRKFYRAAVVNYEGLVFGSTSKYELPRFLVRNWDGDTFHKRLQLWFKRGIY